MKSFYIITSTLLCLFFLTISCSSDEDGIYFDDYALELNGVKNNYSTIENDICNLVNEHREKLGLSTLIRIEIISTVAKGHTNYMIDIGNISHDNFLSRSKYLMDNAAAKDVGENLAYAYATAQSVMNAWIKSPGHKKTLENTKFTHFGISVEEDSNGRKYFTNIFITK